MNQTIHTKNAPKPIGPYSQAILSNNTLYISGQIAINPITNTLVLETIETETLQVMKNLEAILHHAKCTFLNVVKTSIFIKNMDDFTDVNKVYSAYFNTDYAPARETIAVSKLPKNVNVEISMIATLS